MNKICSLFIISFILVGCQSAKDAFTLKKKSAADEFLVEKKSPLVLPPNYGELPKPSEDIELDQENNIKVTLGKEELKIEKTIKNSEPTSLEKSVLEKIK